MQCQYPNPIHTRTRTRSFFQYPNPIRPEVEYTYPLDPVGDHLVTTSIPQLQTLNVSAVLHASLIPIFYLCAFKYFDAVRCRDGVMAPFNNCSTGDNGSAGRRSAN